jgi:large subunit ribosomal protein L14
MVNYLTRLVIADNTGIRQVQCITLLGKTRSNVTKIGNLIVMVAKRLFSWSQFKKGVVLRGLVVRTCLRFYRGAGV